MSVTASEQLPLLVAAPNGIRKLRELILELAVHGKLVAQNPGDEPASELLKRIAVEKKRLVAEGRIKQQKMLAEIAEEERPFEVPQEWAWARLGEVCAYIQRGKGPTYVERSEYVVISQKCVRWTGLDLAPSRSIDPSSIGAYEEVRFLRPGDILWNSTGTGTIGRACVVEERLLARPLVADSHVTVVRALELLPAFVWRWIQSSSVQSKIEGNASGTTNQIELNTSTVISHLIPLPPISEQHRIVAKVDELMALCDRLEAQQAGAESAHAQLVAALLGSLTQDSDADDFAASWQRFSTHFHTLFTTESSIDALKQVILQLAVMGKLVPQDSSDEPASELVKRIHSKKIALLDESKARKQKALDSDVLAEPPYAAPSGWKWQTVDSVLHVTGGITLGRKLIGRNVISKPYLRVANVQRGHLDLHQVKDVEVLEDEAEKYLLRDGDLLITEGGDWDKVGRTAIWRNELPECLHQNHVFRARAVTTEWEPRWAEMYLNATPAREYFAGSSKQTTNLASINMTQLRACAFPVPPLAEQHRIVAKVDQLMALCDQLSAAIQRCNQHSRHLADALVDKALSPASKTSTNVVDMSCYLVGRLVARPTFGRTTHMKLIYLAEAHLGFNFQGKYVREAAGPFDKHLHQVEKQAEANGWYTHATTLLKSGKEKVIYRATDALAAKARQVAEALGDKRQELDRLITLLGDRKTEEVEIVATLFAAWNDALLDGQSPGNDWIIREVRENWHVKKQRFTPAQLRHWLDWMRQQRLVPMGRLPRTMQQPDMFH